MTRVKVTVVRGEPAWCRFCNRETTDRVVVDGAIIVGVCVVCADDIGSKAKALRASRTAKRPKEEQS